MPLLLRPTKLASPAFERLQDWLIVEDGRTVAGSLKMPQRPRPTACAGLVDSGLRASRVRYRDQRQGTHFVGSQG